LRLSVAARTRILSRVWPAAADPLLRSAYSLGVNALLTAALGMVFWVVAARIYPSSTVGRDSAIIAAMMQLSTIAQLNLANALVRFMPGYAHAPRLLAGAYALSAVAALVVASGFVLLAPGLVNDLRFLSRDTAIGVVFVGSDALWGVFALQDAALTAMRRAAWVPVENTLFGALKLLALPVLLWSASGHGPFFAWVVPMALLLMPVNWLLFRRVFSHTPGNLSPTLAFAGRRLVRFLAFDYLATVFLQTSLTVLPLIIVATLGIRANAHFYIPFTIALALEAMFFSMATSLVAEAAREPERLPELLRALARRFAVIALPTVGVLVVAAPLVMLLFGHEYARESTPVLRVLLCASLFRPLTALATARDSEIGSRVDARAAAMQRRSAPSRRTSL
jgi:O-antigen/teichoic acid export membrane protein